MKIFLKYFLPAALLSVLAACGGGGTAPPTGNDPPKETELRLVGKVGFPGPEVVATVGGVQFEGLADADGSYELEIPLAALRDGDVLRLDARGGQDQERLHLVSAFMNAAALVDAAGDDRILDSTEATGVDVSAISTAKYAALYQANDGHVVQSTAFHAIERDALTADRVATLAAAVDLTASGAISLPAGTDSTWELVSDAVVSRDFLADVRSGGATATITGTMSAKGSTEADPVLAAIDELLASPEPFTADMLPDEYVMLERTRSDLELRAHILRFNDDGTGTHITVAGENAMTWVITDGGRLVVTPAAGKRVAFVVPNLEFGPYDVEQEILGDLEFTLLSSGDAADLVTVLYRVSDLDMDVEDVFDPAVARVMYRALTAMKPGMHAPFELGELAGRTWVMPGVASDVTQGREIIAQQVQPLAAHMNSEALLTFSEDGTGAVSSPDLETGAIAPTDETFTWAITESGELEAVFTDGATVTWRKMGNDGIALDVLVMAKDSGTGETLANGGLAVPFDGETAFTVEGVAGRQARFGTGAGSFDLQDYAPLAIEYLLDPVADHAGKVDMPIWQELDRDPDKAWRIVDGDILIGAFRSRTVDDEQQFHFDPTCLSVENCYLQSQVRLLPLARDGERIYTLEVQDDYRFLPTDTSVFNGAVEKRRISVNYWEPETSEAGE